MLLLATLLYLSIRDMLTHRITHLSLLFLFIVGIFDKIEILNVKLALCTFAFGLMLFYFCGVGAGDVKLSTILILLFVPSDRILEFVMITLMLSLPMWALTFMHSRSLKSSIPLAPMLCGAVLLLPLA